MDLTGEEHDNSMPQKDLCHLFHNMTYLSYQYGNEGLVITYLGDWFTQNTKVHPAIYLCSKICLFFLVKPLRYLRFPNS